MARRDFTGDNTGGPSPPYKTGMIPVALTLAGFLSWREPQTLRFDTGRLTLLTGPNGGGKSALFDAITFALFGHHRGGGSGHADLLHKDCDLLSVDFEFRILAQHYRVLRTVKRSRSAATGTQQIQQRADVDWQDVPETAKKAGFDAWIRKHLGFSYESFTAAVLLAQNHAERLLDATPKGRAEVLGDLVGLDDLRNLHALANQERLKAKAVLDAVAAQATSVPPVTDADIAAAHRSVLDTEAITQRHRMQREELNRTADELQRYTELRIRLESATAKVTQAESLLKDAAKIEHDAARLDELTSVLPVAEAVVVTRNKLHDSDRKSERLLKQQETQKQIQTAREHDLTTAKAKRSTLQFQLTNDDATLAKTAQRLRELTGTLQTLRLLDETRADAARLDEELARLPTVTAAEIATARQRQEHLIQVGQWLPVALRLQRETAELASLTERKTELAAACDRIRKEGETARKDHDALQKQRDTVATMRSRAETALTEAAVLVRQAQVAFDEFAGIGNESMCRACGQPLTPQHRELELLRRRTALTEATANWERLQKECETAVQRDDEMKIHFDASTENLTQLRIQFKEQSAALTQVTGEIDRTRRTLSTAATERPPGVSEDVDYLEREFATLDETKRTLKQMQDAHTARQTLDTQRRGIEATRKRLQSGLPDGDSERLREEHRIRQAEETSLLAAVKAGRKALDDADREIDKLGREAHAALTEFTDITGRLRTEEATRQHCRETIDREMRKLPAEWQMRVESAGLGDYAAWKDSQAAFLAAQIPQRMRDLAAARLGVSVLQEEAARLETEVAASPLMNGLDADDIGTRLESTRQAITIAEDAAQTARRHLLRIEGYRDQRAHLDQSTRAAEVEHAEAKRLADLLGRDGLQRHLVRDAERQIVEHTNAVLGRLSDDALRLQLAANGDADAALTLEAVHPATSTRPISVAFLSGSQRFRVAVALALGIGKFVKAADTLLLDEGFGSLDRLGRAGMLRELTSLQHELQCLIVVSHDDDFVNAFHNGYRIELVNGTSVATNLV